MHALSPEAPFGKDSDTIPTKWYSKGASGWGMLFSLEAPFGKDYETILTRWGFQDNSKNSKKSKATFPNLSKSPFLVRMLYQMRSLKGIKEFGGLRL